MNPTNEMTRAIDVGGRRLVLTTSGDGAPTVVLETGLGAESDEWSAVQRAIVRFARGDQVESQFIKIPLPVFRGPGR